MPTKENRPTFQGLTVEAPRNLELWKSKMTKDRKKTIQLSFDLWFSDVLLFSYGKFMGGVTIVKRNDSSGLNTPSRPKCHSVVKTLLTHLDSSNLNPSSIKKNR